MRRGRGIGRQSEAGGDMLGGGTGRRYGVRGGFATCELDRNATYEGRRGGSPMFLEGRGSLFKGEYRGEGLEVK